MLCSAALGLSGRTPPLQASPLEAPVVELLGEAFDACRDFAANDGDLDRLQWHARTVCRARNTVLYSTALLLVNEASPQGYLT